MIDNGIIIRRVDFLNDKEKIRMFLSELKEGGKTFRYFKKRPLEIIQNHLLTILASVDKRVVGYAHLDEDGNDKKIWLGVAVADKWRGKGIGKSLIKYLLEFASKNMISEIFLSVDDNNKIAINLYKKIGFKALEKKDAITIYKFSRL